MRRKIAATASGIFVGFLAWAIPEYLEVNGVITQDNSYWLLVSIGIGAFIAVCILMWGFWLEGKRIWNSIISIRLRSPVYLGQGQCNLTSVATSDFSVKLENLIIRNSGIWFDRPLVSQQPTTWLVATISFKTNQAIQIASIHLEIDPIDPRDIIELDLNLVQGFSLPHVLYRSETHQFQFQLSPDQAENVHNLLLKVLAGGNWYTDGPYRINERESQLE